VQMLRCWFSLSLSSKCSLVFPMLPCGLSTNVPMHKHSGFSLKPGVDPKWTPCV
jgi:hypothetical protein